MMVETWPFSSWNETAHSGNSINVYWIKQQHKEKSVKSFIIVGMLWGTGNNYSKSVRLWYNFFTAAYIKKKKKSMNLKGHKIYIVTIITAMRKVTANDIYNTYWEFTIC